MVERIGLVGAAGAMGQSVARALAARGKPFRVIGRSAGALEASFRGCSGVERVTWNPDDAASVRAAVRGLDTLVYLVGVPYHRFDQHPVVMRQTLAGAIAEGGSAAGARRHGVPVRDSAAPPRSPRTTRASRTPSRAGCARRRRISYSRPTPRGRSAGPSSGFQTSTGRAIEKSFLHDAFVAALQGRTANLIGPIDTPHEFVFVPDVGPVLLDLADRPEAYGRWWHLGGAGTITQRDFVTRVFTAVGRTPKFRVAGKTTLRLMGLFNPLMRELVEMSYLHTTPVVLDDSALQKLLGPVKKTSYEQGIRKTLEAMRQESGAARAA